jgi:hypothetical protein
MGVCTHMKGYLQLRDGVVQIVYTTNFSLGGTTRNHLAKIIGKLDPI